MIKQNWYSASVQAEITEMRKAANKEEILCDKGRSMYGAHQTDNLSTIRMFSFHERPRYSD